MAAGFSADGMEIAWGNTDKGTVNSRLEPFEYALALPQGADAFAAPRALDGKAAESFRRAEASHGAWSLSHRKGGAYG